MADKVVMIVQARMTSTRLPGKVLKEVMGKPLLGYQLERLQAVSGADELVVATTLLPTDDPVVALCKTVEVETFRGGEEDVLGRYAGAAEKYGADVIVRMTADCPLMSPVVVGDVIGRYGAGGVDYMSNTLVRTLPRGMDVEVFSRGALEEAHDRAVFRREREHVTPYIYGHPERFRLSEYLYGEDCSHHRWTVDTVEDFQLISRILEALYPVKGMFTLEDILALLARNPEWVALNAHVEQKL